MIKEFLAKYKNDVKKIIYLLLCLIGVTAIATVILSLCKVIYYEDGLKLNVELFRAFSSSFFGVVCYLLLQCIVLVFLCALPGSSLIFTMLSTVIFDRIIIAFVVSLTGIMLSSVFMYLLGRIGGYKLCEKLIGKEDIEKATKFMRERATIYFPIMMTFPIFPDNALVMLAGVSKMKLSWFLPSAIFGRGIGVVTTVFGLAIVPFENFTGIYDWLVFITVCVFWIILVFGLAKKLNDVIEKRRNNKE